MLTRGEFYIFETLPREQRAPGKAGWWSNVQRGKQVPYAFARGIRFTSDVLMLGLAAFIALTTHAPVITIAGLEVLFVSICALFFLSRKFKQFLAVVGTYLAIIGLGILLNLLFPGTWGSVGLNILCVIILYRFPLQWSLPLAIICVLALILTNGALRLEPVQHVGNAQSLAFSLLLAVGLGWFGWTQRAQYLLVVRLHEAQEQLRAQMVHNEELAATRERTRIARDIHDVLSHSLAVLSIQVQAARHLLTRDPARLATKLEDMATLIRESIAESRRVVGLLRDTPSALSGQDDLGLSLRATSTTFNERTGISCRFDESGIPRKVSPQQQETLRLALREMLTNAHRHGAAQIVWITLRWQETNILLEVRDDGTSAHTAHVPSPLLAEASGNGVGAGGHHGLEGMRERAATLGGEVEAGPAQTGGFAVTLRLPYEQAAEIAAQKVKERE